ncbi:MAG: glycosyltransferase [Paraglaciecola sp.]|uniref:glycosyltransferase n=1 Tax=Paraglaciecola sp. TaxID=1920173 RepID=UPI0032641437
MKVLIFVASLRSGGAERQTVELIKGLANDKDIEIELVSMSEETHYSEIFELNIKTHYLVRRSRFDVSIFWRFFQLVKTIKPDVIHSWNSMCSIYTVPTVFFQNIKFINGFLRGAPPTLPRFKQEWMRVKFTFPFSDIILSNSKAGLVSYSVPESKAKFVHNGFDLTRVENLVKPEDVKTEFQLENDIVVSMIASFSQNKDFETFIKVAIKVLSTRNDVTFLLIGDGKNLTPCKGLVPKDLQEKIKFLGKQKNVERIIQISDIGVLLSTHIHGEGISNSIMEFMALGKPVLASNSGGNNEIVDDGKTGIICKVEDFDSAYKGLDELLTDPDKRIEYGNLGKKILFEKFNLGQMVENYRVLYSSLK